MALICQLAFKIGRVSAFKAEYDGSNNLLKRYVHGSGVDGPLVVYSGSGFAAPSWLHRNWQGSIIAFTDAAGNRAGVNSYDEYGFPGAANTGRFQYTGQIWIPEIGMYHYKARVYSPVLGRFLQTDPIGYRDDNDLYTYVGNDPLDHTDPAGTSDVNLFKDRDSGKYLHDIAAKLKIDHTFVIAGHGGGLGVLDDTPPNLKMESRNPREERYGPDRLLGIATKAGFKHGGQTVLVACGMSYPFGKSQTSFAQQYAKKSGGPVLTASGHVNMTEKGNNIYIRSFDPNKQGALSPFNIMLPNGKVVTTGTTIVVNTSTGADHIITEGGSVDHPR